MSVEMKLPKKESEFGKCCPVMELVLLRVRPGDKGMQADQAWDLKKRSGFRPILVHRMHRGKKTEDPKFRDSTFAVITFCPFCGKRVPNK